MACYAEHSILKLLGFGSQSTVIETFKKRSVEYMVFGANMYVQAKLPPSIQKYQICMCTQILLNNLRWVIVKYQ